MRRFAEGAAAFDRGEQVSQPQDRGSGGLGAWLIDFHGRADLKPLHKAFEIMVNDNPAMAQQGDQEWLDLGLCERNPALAERALAIAGDGFAENGLHFSYNFNKACVARTFGHDDIARSAFIAARGEVRARCARTAWLRTATLHAWSNRRRLGAKKRKQFAKAVVPLN